MSEQQGSLESFEDKREVAQPGYEGHVALESLARKHEVQGVSLRPLLIFTAGLAGALLVISLVLWRVIAGLTEGQAPPAIQLVPAAVTPVVSEGPGIESAPARARLEVVEPALERITTYGWVDKEAGVIHMPIDEAMRRLVEQGVPAAEGEVPAVFEDDE
jgi:hypothetical protein